MKYVLYKEEKGDEPQIDNVLTSKELYTCNMLTETSYHH